MKFKSFARSYSLRVKIFSMFPLFIPTPKFWNIFFIPESYFLKLSRALFPFISIWFSAENISAMARKDYSRRRETLVSSIEKIAERKRIMEKKMLITREFFPSLSSSTREATNFYNLMQTNFLFATFSCRKFLFYIFILVNTFSSSWWPFAVSFLFIYCANSPKFSTAK